MAVTRYRPCIVCGEMMKTQRASKKTCSSTCSMRLSRELRKPVVQATYTIQNKRTSGREEPQMSVTQQQEIRLRMHGIDVTILVDHRPADESLPNMTAEEIKAYVETAIANLMITGDIHA